MPTHANPCGAATTWVVWANTWTNTCCGFLGIHFSKVFFALFFGSRQARTSGPILTIYTTRFHPRMCLLGVSVILLPILGVKFPKTPIVGAWIGKILKFAYYRSYCTDYNQILLIRKDHQILFVGGTNRRKTNPTWRTAAILKIENRPYLLKSASSRGGTGSPSNIWFLGFTRVCPQTASWSV